MLMLDMSDPLPSFETLKSVHNGEEMLLLVMKQSPNREEKEDRPPSETNAMDSLHDVTFYPFEAPEDALRNLLTRWNLLHLFEILKNENMTLDVLKILNNDELKELTHTWKMGDKVLFNYHFEKWREEINLPITVRKSHSPFGEHLSAALPCTDGADLVLANVASSLNNLTPRSTGSRSPSNRSLHSVDISPETTTEKNRVTVAEILASHRNGQRIIEAYKKHKRLNEEQRNLVITMIGSYFDNRSYHMSLQTSYRLEKEILAMFPTEKVEFYRTERRGRIYTKYQNIKKSSKVFSDDEGGDAAMGPKSPKIQKVDCLLRADLVAETTSTCLSHQLTLDVLKILNNDELKELTHTWKMGDKVLFNYHFEKWREEINLPITVRKSHSPFGEHLSAALPCTDGADLVLANVASSLNNLTPRSTGSRSPSNRSLHSVDISPETTTEKNRVTVAEILASHRNGQRIIEAYKKHKRLNEEQRNLVITMIGSYFDNRSYHMSLQTSYRLEKEILAMFPTEKVEFYRTERRGRIYTKYQNIKKSSKVFSDDEGGDAAMGPKSPKIQKVVPEQDASAWVHTLKYANLTSVEFDITWQACSNYRINQIFNECQNITDILNKWPQYLRPQGYKLIDKDFNVLFKNYDNFNNWGGKMQKLCKFLKKLKHVRDVSNKKILESILAKHAGDDLDLFSLKTLWCLHSYLHPTSRFVRRDSNGHKNIQRFTVKDSQESFLYVDLTIQGLEKHIESLLHRGESIQPFILAVGDTMFSSIEQCFVYLDGTLIAFDNFLRALDVCFKSFHLFNLQYPKASDPFWTFIEAYFYDIDTGSKKSYKINTLLQELRD